MAFRVKKSLRVITIMTTVPDTGSPTISMIRPAAMLEIFAGEEKTLYNYDKKQKG